MLNERKLIYTNDNSKSFVGLTIDKDTHQQIKSRLLTINEIQNAVKEVFSDLTEDSFEYSVSGINFNNGYFYMAIYQQMYNGQRAQFDTTTIVPTLIESVARIKEMFGYEIDDKALDDPMWDPTIDPRTRESVTISINSDYLKRLQEEIARPHNGKTPEGDKIFMALIQFKPIS